MATEEVRRLRHQMAGKVREYEGHLMRLEGQLLVLRARVERAAGDAAAGLSSLLTHIENHHLQQNASPSVEFLVQANRRICERCRVFAPAAGLCRHCLMHGLEQEPVAAECQEAMTADEALEGLRKFAPTLHHIPYGSQSELTSLFSELLQRASDKRRVEDVFALLMMPRYILSPLQRGGRRHEGKAAKIIHDRILSWQSGTREVEQSDMGRPRRSSRKPAVAELDASAERLVLAAVKDKALSKACKILLGSALPPAEDIERKLRALHPEGELPPSGAAPAHGNYDFDAGQVEQALQSFDTSSGGGPSGLRPQHLKEMLRCPQRQQLLEALAGFCSALVNGHFPRECMRLLTAARLVALPKKDGGVRPIAMGDTLRRLAAKCVHSSVLESVSRYLLPLQVGVQVPNAAEIVARKVKLWAREAEERISSAASGFKERL